MKRVWVVLTLLVMPVFSQIRPGHQLPEGTYHPAREREIDIQDYKADLHFDMDKEEITGAATLTFTSLRTALAEFSLDAADLQIKAMSLPGNNGTPSYEVKDRKLRIRMPRALNPGQAAVLTIEYACRPKTGMYFFPKTATRSAQAWNYGEGGLHYAWLPIYNDTNDRFTAEFSVTVARPYSVLSNGRLIETRDNPDRTRTFRWVQDKPIPNYLLTIDVGEFARIPIGEARAGSNGIPLAAWCSPGMEETAKFAFRDTPRMVEFFSQKLSYPYPWSKYDQIALREFAIGAMETTTATGFSESHLHHPDDPPDSAPAYEEAYPSWSYEDTIAHELAHHWFGDLVTCSSLGSIWLNESFATFCHTIWNGHAHGEDDLTYQRWRYLNKYLGYVQKTGTVRPMEYFKYRAPHEMYQTETTYLKGSLVLHMLRHFVGDADFFRSLTAYLRKHEYQSVDSAALKRTFDETCGTNLTWFFDDWIIGGGGHPVLDVTCLWSAERRQIDLSVAQMQTNLPFENDFRLPVDVEIFTAAGSKTHGIVLEGWSTHVSLPAESKPLAVVFDKGNWLIGELRFRRTLREVLYQLERGDLAGKLRAARDLATDFAGHSESAAALARILGDTGSHWGLRQEAALDLGRMTIAEARSALVRASADPDRRIRRAVAIALGTAAGVESETALRRMIETDPTEDVAAAAEISLGRLHAAGAGQLFARQLSRDSRYWNSIRLGALIGLAQLGDPELASSFQSYTDPKWEAEVRLAALDGWHRARADDPALPARLRDLARDRNREVRLNAIGRIGELHRPADLRFLRELAENDSDPDISEAARSAAEVINHFVRKEK